MQRRRGAAIPGLALLVVALAGCGNSRTQPPSLTTPASSTALRTLSFPSLGLHLRVPRSWSVGFGKAPLLATISSGTAVIAVWRFPRSLPPPAGLTALTHARIKLISEARTRDPGLHLIRSKIARIGGSPSVELDAFERVAGQPRRVRSTHVFERNAELVLEEYAPAQLFHTVDHTVFSPLKRSLVLSAAVA